MSQSIFYLKRELAPLGFCKAPSLKNTISIVIALTLKHFRFHQKFTHQNNPVLWQKPRNGSVNLRRSGTIRKFRKIAPGSIFALCKDDASDGANARGGLGHSQHGCGEKCGHTDRQAENY